MKNTILCAEKILVGKDLEMINNGCIIVEDKKIKKIVSQSELTAEDKENAEVIDFGNKTLMPGLIECHNHLCLDARIHNHLELLSYTSEAELALIAEKGLKDDLYSGVTTARCLGDKYYIDVNFKRKINEGTLIGPNLLVAGIGMKGLHGHGFIGTPFTGKEAFTLQCRENMAKNVDILKIFVTPGSITEGHGFVPSFVSPEEIRTVAEEAKRKNIPTAAHCIGGMGLKNCVENGISVIEHMYAASDEDIEILKNSDCWVDLTSGIYLDAAREEFVSEAMAAKYRKGRQEVAENISKLIKSGVRFVIGTDANHGLLYKEVGFAVDLGADILTALKGVTSNAAIVCRMADRIGSLEEGYDADIIAVDGNPLEDVSVLKDVSYVMKDGKEYLRK